MVSFCPSTFSAYSKGTCVKRLVTSKLTSRSSGLVWTSCSLRTNSVEFLTVYVDVLPLSGIGILANSLARQYVRRIPNGGENGSHWHSFLVYFREYIHLRRVRVPLAGELIT